MVRSRVNKTEEAAIEKHLVESIEKIGGLAWKFTSPGIKGVPDRIIMLQEYIFFVEVKAPGEDMRKLQKWRKMQLEREGFAVLLIDTKSKVDELIENIVGGRHEQLRSYVQFSRH